MEDKWNTMEYFSIVEFQSCISIFSSPVHLTANKNGNRGKYPNKVSFSHLRVGGLTPCGANSFTSSSKHSRNNSLQTFSIIKYF